MSAPIVQADYEAMEQIARRFQQQNQQLLTLKQRVDRGVGALRNGGWQGAGSAAFAQEMDNEVTPATQRLIDALAEARQVTLQVNALIRQAEEEAASVFRGEGQGGNGNGPVSSSGGTSLGGAMGWGANGATPPTAVTAIPPRDHALLSAAAYADGGELSPEMKAKGWRIMDIGQTDTGYYGVAYVNDRTQEVVIAHRGTNPDAGDVFESLVMASPVGVASAVIGNVLGIGNPLRDGMRLVGINSDGNDLDDDAQLALEGAPDQFHESQTFVRSVMSQIQAGPYSEYSVSHTGHSLGAVLADLHAAQYGQQAVTFDNPGSKEILNNLGVLYNHEHHISYQSHANLINTTNTPAGYAVHMQLNSTSDQFGIIRDTLHDHSLENMIDALDPTTGLPWRAGAPVLH
jgi:WXG100 family type VII secretion target